VVILLHDTGSQGEPFGPEIKTFTSNFLKISTTPIMAMGCRQCLPLSVVQLIGKHCKKKHCRNGVVDTFGHYVQLETPTVQSLY
jgi:hypothetical protein